MLPAIPFYIIRHGESEANLGQYASGHVDVALTEKGWEQARAAARTVAALELKPTVIIHSHLQRAKNTAAVINEGLNLPMVEDPLLAEQMYGDWEGVSWDITRQPIRDGIDPPNGESHAAFHIRIKDAITRHVTEQKGQRVLFVCHGGVFRAIGSLYSAPMTGIKNCALHAFHPDDANTAIPWRIETFGDC